MTLPITPEFPNYSAAEKAADAIIHVLGIGGAGIAIVQLIARSGSEATIVHLLALEVYGLGLLSMLIASASYNLMPVGRFKPIFRQIDHAMIFVMIAGSYTPFAVNALPAKVGVPLCLLIWLMAVIGVTLRLGWGRIYARFSLGLYLCMGWLVLVVLPPLAEAVSTRVLLLLLLGGVIYSLGSLVHARVTAPFHNAIWHAMVLIGAGLHFGAVASLS
jgi:hemolysin III